MEMLETEKLGDDVRRGTPDVDVVSTYWAAVAPLTGNASNCINCVPTPARCSRLLIFHHSHGCPCLFPPWHPPPLLCFRPLSPRLHLPPQLTHSRHRALPFHRRHRPPCFNRPRVNKGDQSEFTFCSPSTVPPPPC